MKKLPFYWRWVAFNKPTPLRWLSGWATILDGIIKVLTLGSTHTSFNYQVVLCIARRTGRKLQEKSEREAIERSAPGTFGTFS